MREPRLRPVRPSPRETPATSTRGACPSKPVALPPPPHGPRIDQAGWRAVLWLVSKHRPALANLLERAAVRRFDAERVTLGYKADSLLLGLASEASARFRLLEALTVHFGGAPELVFETIVGEKPVQPRLRREPRGPKL